MNSGTLIVCVIIGTLLGHLILELINWIHSGGKDDE